MRKIIGFIIVIVLLTSCSAPKQMKDCRGVKHTKQKGGFYL